ncbi:MAG: aminotransferase class I/II-fold pyridoxal phosphate-dependent enzyme [Planctomycetota bacterium]|nr:MAG: aminotransferase class I/II-fold pyridoxal phosphate-dependent enzyme [Planctomycetota bacterium]
MQQADRSASFFYPETLVHLLRHRATYQPDGRAFTYLRDGEIDELHTTYSELDQQARAIGAWLEAMGLEGERALLIYPAGMEFVAAFFGCLYAGVTAVPINPPRRNAKISRVEAIVDDAEARVALTTEEVLDRMHGVIVESTKLKQLTWQATDVVGAGMAEDWKMPDVTADTLAFLQYTSGSTGTPKGVMLTQNNLMHNSALINLVFEHTRSGTGVFWLPNYHDMGLIGGILQPLYVGRPNVLMSPMAFLQKPFRWLKAITNYRGTTSGGPNFAYELCIEKITEEQMQELDLSCWQVAFNGAEPVRAETIDAFTEKFAACGFRREAFFPCYGMAEATLMVSGGYVPSLPVVRSYEIQALSEDRAVRSEEHSRRLVGSGENLPDQEIVIADPETFCARPNRVVGEIWVRGPSIAKGYLKRPKESAETFGARLADTGEGPYLRTGDLGFLDDGELFVTGRLKDLIILRGKNYYPQDIEHTAAHSHPGLVVDACAAFATEEDGQQQLVIVQEVGRTRHPDTAAITAAIRAAVAREHELVVAKIILIRTRSIPKTSSGKIQRRACRELYESDQLNVVGTWCAGEPLPAVEEPARVDSPPTVTSEASNGSPDSAAARPMVADEDASRNGSERPTGTTREVVERVVREIGKDRVGDLDLDTNIVELGLDSLERFDIVNRLETLYGGRFPESTIAEMETCAEVIAAVDKYLVAAVAKVETPRPDDFDVPSDYYNFAEVPEYLKLKQTEQLLGATGIPNPYFSVHEQVTSDVTIIDGEEYVNYCSYNYLAMSGDPVVTKAAQDALDQYGTSASASRLVSGEKKIHRELEQAIGELLDVPAVITFAGGHATNETTIGHLFGAQDLIVYDELAHNSIVQGAILSGARRRPFRHNDYHALDAILRECRHEYRRVLVAIEGVYSMDGDFADIPEFVKVKKRHKCFLMVDEAHSMGVMGKRGFGMREYYGVDSADVDIWMGTLSKSFGSFGGYVGGREELVDYLKYTAPGFVFAAALPPSCAAAALTALRLIQQQPERVAKLAANAELFLRLARERGLNTGTSGGTPIIPIILGNSLLSLQLSYALKQRRINVQPILYPAVEENASRLRFFLTSKHTEEQIRMAVDAVAEELTALDPGMVADGLAKQREAQRVSSGSVD